jgi:YbbR domain-containing protein
MLRKIFLENLSYKILSLLLAILLYFYVLGERNPISERVWTVNLEVRNLTEGIYITNTLPKIEVKLRGPKQIILGMTTSQIKAYIDLKGKKPGTHLINVGIIAPQEVELVSISPEKVEVDLDILVRKEFPIEINKIGTLPPDYLLEKAEVIPNVCKAEGYEKTIEKIRHIIATIDISSLTSDYKKEVYLRAIDREGGIISEVELKPSTVVVYLKISPVLKKEVPVEVYLSGKPATGYKIEKIEIIPNTVIARGPKEKIYSLTVARTAPVNVDGITQDIEINAAILSLEDAITFDKKQINVKIKVAKEE